MGDSLWDSPWYNLWHNPWRNCSSLCRKVEVYHNKCALPSPQPNLAGLEYKPNLQCKLDLRLPGNQDRCNLHFRRCKQYRPHHTVHPNQDNLFHNLRHNHSLRHSCSLRHSHSLEHSPDHNLCHNKCHSL